MNKELLNLLCKKFGYTWYEIGAYIKIVSKRGDSWYILNCDHEGRPIHLQHENSRGNCYMHSHGKHDSLEDVFKCIYSHDNREMLRTNKMIRINNIINNLQLKNTYNKLKSNV